MANMDWNDLQIFLCIVEEGSLSAAADRLDLSQPTVGRRLTALEEAAGVTLFARSTRSLLLTEAGRSILESAKRMQSEARTIERVIEGQVATLAGEVKISVVEGLGTQWLPAELPRFHEDYPDITINVQVESRMADLHLREADIALRLKRPHQPDLIAKRLVNYGFGFYAHKAYLDKHGRPETPADLAYHRLIGWQDALFQPAPPDNSEWAQAYRGQQVFKSNSPSAQFSATRAGLGIGLHSHRWAMSYDFLERIFPDVSISDVELWLVAHEDLRHSARIRAVYDFLAERIAEQRGVFERGER